GAIVQDLPTAEPKISWGPPTCLISSPGSRAHPPRRPDLRRPHPTRPDRRVRPAGPGGTRRPEKRGLGRGEALIPEEWKSSKEVHPFHSLPAHSAASFTRWPPSGSLALEAGPPDLDAAGGHHGVFLLLGRSRARCRSPFPDSPRRTVHAPFKAHGSPSVGHSQS